MKVLIVASSRVDSRVLSDIRAGRHPRVDYLELDRQKDWLCIETPPQPPPAVLGQIEAVSRLDLRQALRVARLVGKSTPDVVFSLSERVGVPLALMLPRSMRHVVWMHHPLSRPKLDVLSAVKLPHRWTNLYTLSRAEQSALASLLPRLQQRIGCLPYHVDTCFFDPEQISNEAPLPRNVLSVGLSYRDYPTLLRAIRMRAEIPLRIQVGSSWLPSSGPFGREVLPDNVSVGPFVHPIHLRELYRKSRFVVVPIASTSQWAAGCTTVLQAQSMGRPVIVTQAPGIAEYCAPDGASLLVEAGNSVAMADAIATLWHNPRRAEEMGRRAREWVARTFSIERWLSNVEVLIRDGHRGTAL